MKCANELFGSHIPVFSIVLLGGRSEPVVRPGLEAAGLSGWNPQNCECLRREWLASCAVFGHSELGLWQLAVAVTDSSLLRL